MTKLILMLAVFAAVALAITAVANRISNRKMSRALTAGPVPTVAPKSAEDKAMLFAQIRALVAVVFTVSMFAAMFRVSIGMTGLVGLPVALTAGFSASAGLLLYSALPAAKLPPTSQNSAALVRREPWSFGKRRTFLVPLVVVAALAAFLTATGLTSSPDGQGRYRVIQLADALSSTASSPYPGWYYGIPLALVTLVLAASTYLALRRISSTPALPDPRMAALDRRWREISTQVVVRMATGALLGYFGGTAVIAGQALMNVSSKADGMGHAQPHFALGITSAATGAALALAGVVLLVLAIRGALTIRTTVRQPQPEAAANK